MTTESTLLSQTNARREKLLTAIALVLILSLGAFLRFYELGAHSIGNTYYAATVKSMLTSWSNFFFGAFEPGGSVTVDKPPLGFWIESLSAALLGINGFSLALPNALAGVGSIALLYHLVKKQISTAAALIAALTLAVVPITIATERNNTIDGMLVFVLLLAVWAVWKSVESGKLRYLLLGAFIVGLGFNIKMLQAYMILPALYALYFFGAKKGWLTRIWHLGAATLLLVVVSLSWAIAVDLTPAENRPFIGSSEDNSVLELIIGHNGLSRLGLNGNSKRGAGDGQPPSRPQGQLPPLNQQQPQSDQQPPTEALEACSNLTRGDSCTVTLPNRTINGTCIPAPRADSLVCAPADRAAAPPAGQNPPVGQTPPAGGGRNSSETGQAGILRLFSEPLVIEASWMLPFALMSIVLTALTLITRSKDFSPSTSETVTIIIKTKEFLALILWAGWLLPMMIYFSYTTGLFHRYYLMMLGPGLAALTGMAFWSFDQLFKRNRWLGFGTFAFLVTVTLGFQAMMLNGYDSVAWLLPLITATALIAFALLLFDASTQMRTAALTIILLAMLAAPTTWSVMAATNANHNIALPTASLNDSEPTTFMTPNNDVMSDNERVIMEFLLENTEPDSYLLATVSARGAAPYILETGRSVLTLGGFSGSDQIVDVAGLAEMVANGELRYILYSEQINNTHRDIAAWVTETCIPTSVAGTVSQRGASSQRQNSQGDGLRPPSENEVLYDCGN